MNSNNRIATTLYSLGTYFVSGINILHKEDDGDNNYNNNKLI